MYYLYIMAHAQSKLNNIMRELYSNLNNRIKALKQALINACRGRNIITIILNSHPCESDQKGRLHIPQPHTTTLDVSNETKCSLRSPVLQLFNQPN